MQPKQIGSIRILTSRPDGDFNTSTTDVLWAREHKDWNIYIIIYDQIAR